MGQVTKAEKQVMTTRFWEKRVSSLWLSHSLRFSTHSSIASWSWILFKEMPSNLKLRFKCCSFHAMLFKLVKMDLTRRRQSVKPRPSLTRIWIKINFSPRMKLSLTLSHSPKNLQACWRTTWWISGMQPSLASMLKLVKTQPTLTIWEARRSCTLGLIPRKPSMLLSLLCHPKLDKWCKTYSKIWCSEPSLMSNICTYTVKSAVIIKIWRFTSFCIYQCST